MTSRVLLCLLLFLVLSQLVDGKRNRKKNCRGKYLCSSHKSGYKYPCKCIDRSKICDGDRDCPGSDDEENCPCPPLLNPFKGRVDLTDGAKVNSVAKFSCNEGYNVFGPPTRTCLATGAWSGVSPLCQKAACPPLLNPFKGRVDLTDGAKVNSVAKFSCNEGYNVFGPPTRTCLATGAWSGVSPLCQKAGCDCDNKRALTAGISFPVNGGGDVLTRQQFNNSVVERYWVGVYDMIGKNDMGLGHLYDFRQTYSRQFAAGNNDNEFMWHSTRGSTGACTTVESNILPLNDNWAINNVMDLSDNRSDALFEIYISSCPNEYVWLFDCFDFEARKTGTCPVDQTLLMLTVPETNNNVSMDDLPWDAITRDLFVNTNNTVAFCKQSNMESQYILGANSCKSTVG